MEHINTPHTAAELAQRFIHVLAALSAGMCTCTLGENKRQISCHD